MPANTDPIYSAIPNIDGGTLSAANTAKDGTGTTVVLYTAGPNGSFVKDIDLQYKGTAVATVARLFLNNGSSSAVATNNFPLKEISIPALASVSETSANSGITVTIERPIPPGWIIIGTLGTAVAAGIGVTVNGGNY